MQEPLPQAMTTAFIANYLCITGCDRLLELLPQAVRTAFIANGLYAAGCDNLQAARAAASSRDNSFHTA